MSRRVVFVTGTDTGVGKTILTALLLAHGLRQGMSILAVKPFCSGGRQDTELLGALQGDRLPEELLNAFYFEEPVAPLASQRMNGNRVSIEEAVSAIREASKQSDTLLVEGSGGLLVPLGERFTVLDVIVKLRCEVVVASRNKLGTINHTLLTAAALRGAGVRNFRTVLMDSRGKDFSCKTNAALLREFLAPNPLFTLPFLKGNLSAPQTVRRHARSLERHLEQILAPPS